MSLSDSERACLRGGFDGDAVAFDRTRPVCPAEMFDDLVALGGLPGGSRVVEIGCGTGQATQPLAERGLVVTAIELGAQLADVARAKLAGFASVEVITASFEEWEPGGRRFDAVVAFNSLHWVDPELRYAKPVQLLRSSGVLVVADCLWATPSDAHPFWQEVQDDYRAVGAEGDPPPAPESIEPRRLRAEARLHFEEVAARRYPFAVGYSSRDYLANLGTQSVTRQLSEEARREFLARVEARLGRFGWPGLTASFVGLLTIGRLTSRPRP